MKKFVLLLAFLSGQAAFADSTTIAVASNFVPTANDLALAFKAKTGHDIKIASGGTGTLASQICNGAPYTILLAADQLTPQQLIQKQLAVAGKQFTYATGRLVLWSSDPQLVDPNGKVLFSDKFTHLAVANPKLAPYGSAAMQVLNHLNLTQKLEPKFVVGENINSTYQYVASGNAELGFVALSQVMRSGRLVHGGSLWLVPTDIAPGIKQDAVLLKAGADDPLAKKFLAYLKSPDAKKIINRYGYQ